MTMRTVILIRAALPLLLALPQPALAWGKSGHAAIANVAELNLRPAVWSELQTLLATEGATHLSKVASWADTQRAAGDLSDRSRSAADREIALKYIVHLVGDLHQPLHGSDPIGYNMVTLNGAAPVMIHAIWDDTIIDDHGVASALLAQELINNGVATAGGGVPRDWAVESSQIARAQIYDDVPACWSYKAPSCPTAPVPLSADYTTRKYPIVAQRLKQAGYRLATLLNTLLGR
jgi:hypothetical protein